MSTSTRVVAFIVGLVAVFVAALGFGRAFGPADPEQPAHEMAHATEDPTGHDMAAVGGGDGLASTAGGYTLTSAVESLEPGARTIAFTITGPDGTPVTSYDTLHERPLHLIAVRRDLTGYQHLHPTLAASGLWSVSARLQPGFWRLIADFVPSGAAQTTLGTDLVVGEVVTMTALGPDTTTDSVDGYAVSLAGHLQLGHESALTLTVTRDGRPVTDLEPYLDAYGHLVMLRAGDIAYVHVHAVEGSSGPQLAFEADAPEPGRYRLFLDFQHAGVVRTAEFTVTAS